MLKLKTEYNINMEYKYNSSSLLAISHCSIILPPVWLHEMFHLHLSVVGICCPNVPALLVKPPAVGMTWASQGVITVVGFTDNYDISD